jgi:hypothetical protein
VLGALPSAFYRALGKVLLSATTVFTESRTLGIEIQSAKKYLPSAKHSANGGTPQRVVSGHLLLMAVIFAECFTSHPFLVYFYFFIFLTKLFVVCSYIM